jgi:aminoglycoside/choline kinase family phosphotransferase
VLGSADEAQQYAWLERAVDLAALIAERGTPVLKQSERAAGPSLDTSRFVWEMDFFVQHYVGALWRRTSPPPGVRDALHELAGLAAAAPQVLCHRDLHSRNILVRADGSLAMVDIQDARWGPDAYDLASLLRDAYADIDEAWIAPLVERFRGQLATLPPPAAFARRFELVAAQRMIKALGTFGYQLTVRDDPRYAPAIPRTLERLRLALPRLADVPQLAERFASTGLLELPPDLPG